MSSNPYDLPGGRAASPFDGMSMQEYCKQLDERITKHIDLRTPTILKKREDAMVKVIGKALKEERERMHEYVTKALDGALFFKGVYSEGTEYAPGSLVQHGGTVWVTKGGGTGKPGTEGSGWRMLIKIKGATSDE